MDRLNNQDLERIEQALSCYAHNPEYQETLARVRQLILARMKETKR